MLEKIFAPFMKASPGSVMARDLMEHEIVLVDDGNKPSYILSESGFNE